MSDSELHQKTLEIEGEFREALDDFLGENSSFEYIKYFCDAFGVMLYRKTELELLYNRLEEKMKEVERNPKADFLEVEEEARKEKFRRKFHALVNQNISLVMGYREKQIEEDNKDER